MAQAAVAKAFDYLIVGGGSGGIASARRAASYGAKVCVIEGARIGGTCVNVGCVPKKIMWNAASIAEMLHEAKGYGFDVGLKAFSWEQLKEKRDAYIVRLNGIYSNNLGKDGIELISGFAKFVNNNTVEVNGMHLTAKHILIAVGTRPWVPSIPGIDLAITSDGFFELATMPKKVCVTGAGYIGVELAGIFNALGVSTTLVIRQSEFLRSFDTIIKESIMDMYIKAGVKIVSCSEISGIVNTAGATGGKSLDVQIVGTAKGSEKTFSTLNGFDEVVFAAGRVPNIENLNLGATSVTLDKSGYINVDEYQNTDAPGILALGDVCGVASLTPVAIAAGRRLSDRLFGGKPTAKLDYTNVPSVIFSHPTAGSVGITEGEARAKYGAEGVKIYTSKFTNMYYSMTENYGPNKPFTLYKIVCVGPTEKVVGLHIVGRASDEILQGFAVAIKMGATKADFDNCVAIHPTAAEEIVTMK